MNDYQDNSRRRIAEIKMLSERVDAEIVANWLSRRFETCEDLDKKRVLNLCIEALNRDITDKIFDLCGFYKVLNQNTVHFTAKEHICLIHQAETIIRDAITIEELRSRERAYEAETKYIAEQGYVLNERYTISYPDNPENQSQEWLVTEFRLYGNGKIRPVHGCKIKKDGTPYARAQYISIVSDKEIIISKISN